MPSEQADHLPPIAEAKGKREEGEEKDLNLVNGLPSCEFGSQERRQKDHPWGHDEVPADSGLDHRVIPLPGGMGIQRKVLSTPLPHNTPAPCRWINFCMGLRGTAWEATLPEGWTVGGG